MSDIDLIALLADGKFHSGEKLARLLGVSRTAVWKQLKKLEGLEIQVESVKGKGYRLAGGLELLDHQKIMDSLSREVISTLANLDILREIDSTNAYLSRKVEGCHALACIAERQSGGRGRRGRRWLSPFGRNIYLSLGWHFEGGAASLEGLSLAVGLALRRALLPGSTENPDLGLKWPNDLLFQGRKLAGILLEVNGDPSGQCRVVVGVGVNIGMGLEWLARVDQPCADAFELNVSSRNWLAAAILNELVPTLTQFQEQGFEPLAAEWHRYDLCLDKAVTLSTPAVTRSGISRGVNANGALMLETEDGIEDVHGGEISLRLTS
jgi:BirA family transcriptional regulator, biotin operon repressor / biotin---[acetyl-CoA-carboxylase] ligase